MDTANNNYPSLKYPASELSAFAFSIDIFIISLKNGEIIRFIPGDICGFYNWLNGHGIRDIKKDILTLDNATEKGFSAVNWVKQILKSIKK